MLTVKNLNYQVSKKHPFLWHDLNFSLELGKIYTLVGINGVGKTTLLNLLSGLIKPTKGEIYFEDQPIHQSKASLRNYLTNVGYCLQNAENLFFNQTVEEELQYHYSGDLTAIIEELKLESLLKQSPFELSGGQQKRLELAIMLLKKPKILFCDEITAGLDAKNLQLTMDEINYFKSNHIVLMVTHNLSEALTYGDEFLFLKNDGIEQQSKKQVLRNPHVFKNAGLIDPPTIAVCQALINQKIFSKGSYYKSNQEIAQALAEKVLS
ncbi:energy-coupling factor ABC transporter ATP-binding protein [Xylocopilactobacillus apis]|uniref:ABC transporter domain-containing protein n=1 Tax=Xylocopilactobacillus apis TaxID=2932183 RepID=A0AAU9CUS8_9LACO|nr:ABC transporter ATP-binding protein [Xylocopilactobacillus apis]BDR56136.1 hypothetical protein KIMC2_06980 [Xylocopilactobacillus apis]